MMLILSVLVQRSARPAPNSRSRFGPLHVLLVALALFAGGAAFAQPVEFQFAVAPKAEGENPFARELWAEVVTPGGRTVVLPAYYVGKDVFAVRARADEAGAYRLGRVTEAGVEVKARAKSAGEVTVRAGATLPAVQRDRADPTRFVTDKGDPFVPLGANIAWPTRSCVPFYRDALTKFSAAHLNWMRVWMAHWSPLNLDWLADWAGHSPKIGTLDERVAENWDKILAAAEERRVYVQMVFQHHGQYTTGANSNWKDNPWNAANPGGFLKTPTEFFTSPQARALTKAKYRYIVARWGWCPAVFAWELFNEVHWVDPIDKEKNEAVVAAWHGEMADWLRSVDVYRHLVTTSTDNLASPCYDKMDFLQPHLYSADLIVAARSCVRPANRADRPVFYGEIGDDHLDVSDATKQSGVAIVPPAWAGLFGQTRYPAMPWVGATILEQGRENEVGAVQRFLAGTGFAAQRDLESTPVAVESAARLPLVLRGCQVWQRRPAPEIDIVADGRLPFAIAEIPRIYVGWPSSIAEGYPDRATYHLDLPRATTARATLTNTGSAKAGMRFVVDGRVAAEKTWAADAADRPTSAHPVNVTFPIEAGRHTLVVQNAGEGDWVEVAGVDLGIETPVLAATAQRSASFIAAWVWNQRGVFAVEKVPPAEGTLLFEAVPAGSWSVTWWDTVAGKPLGAASSVEHRGGTLSLRSPPIARHAAVVLRR